MEIEDLTEIDVDIVNNIGDDCFNNLPTKIKNDEKVQLLNKYTKKLVRNNYDIPEGVTNHTELKRARYVLYGIMYHFMGDLYAHRLLVPTDAVTPFVENFNSTSSKFNEKRMFDPADFVDSKESTVKDMVLDKTLQFNHIYKYYVTNPSRNYADSPTFYPNRVEEAFMTIWNFQDYGYEGFNEYLIYPCYGFVLNNYEKYILDMGYQWSE